MPTNKWQKALEINRKLGVAIILIHLLVVSRLLKSRLGVRKLDIQEEQPTAFEKYIGQHKKSARYSGRTADSF